MELIILVIFLCVVGFVVWLLTEHIPMDPMFKAVIRVIVLIALVLYVLRRFGGLPNIL